MGYPPRSAQLMLELGPVPDPATTPQLPNLLLSGPDQGRWEVLEPYRRRHLFDCQQQAMARYQRLLSVWKAMAWFEEVHGDLYDTRSGLRRRHGYRELFFQICDGHQLRATLRYIDTYPAGRRYAFSTGIGAVLCPACVRGNLREITYAMRYYLGDEWRILGCEVYDQAPQPPVRCDHCHADVYDQGGL